MKKILNENISAFCIMENSELWCFFINTVTYKKMLICYWATKHETPYDLIIIIARFLGKLYLISFFSTLTSESSYANKLFVPKVFIVFDVCFIKLIFVSGLLNNLCGLTTKHIFHFFNFKNLYKCFRSEFFFES